MRISDRPPDPFWRHRHFDVRHAEFGQRVDHGVHHDAERRRCAALAGRADAERMGGGDGTSLISVT